MPDKDLDLKALATKRERYIDWFGRLQETATVDQARLQRLRREHAARGRSVMSDFIGWMIRELDFTLDTARQVARRVWVCWYEYNDNPAEKLFDHDLSWSYRKKLFDDLRKFTAYLLQTEDAGDAMHELAGKILNLLMPSDFWDEKPPEAILDRYRLDRRK
jgi:hypothetical protein